ncbi:YALI0A17039p [Yarrowia lipolytica CLIB122]|uniref:YALI0A17039p n=2 Tax=Yarrowia lipolytica TaxID=4952 RepID=Q6CGR4_YARLI|nr:YALI0A17039p [Yarrowia lipolytica CLIB122]AOW00757.1 hypothetical protein YALI1_A17118g [Yarrowia lipolytica]KAB8281362.1 hypothetical protein BKA91DRAFT_33647 [Yarrowia lipolytica]KAE8169655.1 hypothetical protein BKA90DRAFT_46767 [Yarrowia lipolytica]KAJ8051739.1 hypothetical protein LXG23DRAFT_51276 [Yarrowia lipolytica]RMI95595.1 hypothetical protein BD777DRAFT_13325 [Yarrowia lipolytica]|eukprot:XP_500148.2 YALI0A17039p [Yarrowia lipolytica CLIB122]
MLQNYDTFTITTSVVLVLVLYSYERHCSRCYVSRSSAREQSVSKCASLYKRARNAHPEPARYTQTSTMKLRLFVSVSTMMLLASAKEFWMALLDPRYALNGGLLETDRDALATSRCHDRLYMDDYRVPTDTAEAPVEQLATKNLVTPQLRRVRPEGVPVITIIRTIKDPVETDS